MTAKDRYRYFRIEARELLDGLSRGVLDLERAPDDRALVARLLRLAHTLKGAARVVQQPAIGDLAHAAEDALSAHRDDTAPPVRRETIDALLRGLDGMAERVAALEPPPPARAPAPEAPAGETLALAAPLARAVRDAARSLGREALFEVFGGDVRVETNVLAAVRDALLHVVRNAVAHGIEPAATRVAAGKPAAGRVRLEVERRGRKVAFRCRDDGRGVDVPAVRAAAIRKGLLDAAAPAPDATALSALLLRGGISTSPEVNAVSGRGVGLDVLRDVASRLQAEASVRSEAGHGTTVELEVPVSLSALTALRLEAGGVMAALPIDAVEQTLFLTPDGLDSSAAGG